MKKFILGLLSIFIVVGVTGCSMKGGLLGVKDFGEQKDEYSPMYIDKLEDSKLAYIKSSKNLIIVIVDDKRITPFYKVIV
ncbi:MAG TPA: hypothetical protein EYO73_10495, partial [Sulfurimonas sp.]|nr:hypothetical protein [Sulfurimonas sp.]